jgi:hypothetical protein
LQLYRSDLLEVDTSVLHYKNKGLDLSALLVPAHTLNPGAGIRKAQEQDHGIDIALDNYLIEQSRPALDEGVSVNISSAVTNLNRYIFV